MTQDEPIREEAEQIAMEEDEADREWAELLGGYEANDREEAGEHGYDDISGSSL